MFITLFQQVSLASEHAQVHQNMLKNGKNMLKVHIKIPAPWGWCI